VKRVLGKGCDKKKTRSLHGSISTQKALKSLRTSHLTPMTSPLEPLSPRWKRNWARGMDKRRGLLWKLRKNCGKFSSP
ncbi:unnamed protein product, partial [Citrullus colocynthis]